MFILTKSGTAFRHDLIYSFNIEEHNDKHHIFCYEVDPAVPVEYSIAEFDSFDEAYEYLSDLVDRINKQ